MKNLTHLFAFAFLVTILFSCSTDSNPEVTNNPFNGDVTLESQKDVDEFGANNYNGVQGHLTLMVGAVEGSTDIVDLTPLYSLTYIEGGLSIIANDQLTNLEGLNNITTIGGRLGISFNDQLQNIDALGNLESLGGNLVIQNCKNLTNIDGLLGLEIIHGFVSIGDVNTDGSNQSLLNISGLANVTSIGGHIIIANNESITDLTGLNNITNINGELRINGNDNLQDLKGLENVELVNGDLTIYGNYNLQNVDQLTNLKQVNGFLNIGYNNSLNSLSGFQNLETIDSFLAISLDIGKTIEPIDFESLTSAQHMTLTASEINSFNNLNTIVSIYIYGHEDDLTQLAGFDNLITIETLEIKNVSEISAFNNLQNVSGLLIDQPYFIHPAIIINGFSSLNVVSSYLTIQDTANQNLNFLESLTVVGDILIMDNTNLSDLCGLTNVFDNNGLTGSFFAGNNLYNPSQNDMENGNCSI